MSTKVKVLSILEINKGSHVSGEKIANDLSISRTAVWKSINELKKDGYIISSIKNKGYCMSNENDKISPEIIKSQIKNQDIFRNIHYFETIDSTNQLAKDYIYKSCDNYTVIIANEQTKGKGRIGRSFISSKDSGIYLSIIFKPSFKNDEITLITSAVGVAVARAIDMVSQEKASIKWVNDIFIKEKKVSGILTEAITSLENNTIEWIIIGIGINVNLDINSLPDELKSKVIGINTLNENVDRNIIISNLLDNVYNILNDINNPQVIREYKKRSNVIGELIEIININEKRLAKAIDINDKGHLIIENEDNTVEALTYGEVSVRVNKSSNFKSQN